MSREIGGEPVRYDDRPSVLMFAASGVEMDDAREGTALAGCRIRGEVVIGEDAAGLEATPAADAAFLRLLREDPAADGLLRRLDEDAAAARCGVVVECGTAEAIDQVFALAAHVIQICAPKPLERAIHIALAARRPLSRLNDIGRDRPPDVLQRLSQEVGRIAHILASLSEEEAAVAAMDAPPDEEDFQLTAGQVRAIIRVRRLREHFFAGDLFADPAWDIVLDLMAARLEQERVAVSSLRIAANVPPTTALRWIKRLTDEGLLVRVADPQDGRRVYIELSESAARAVGAYLQAAQRVAPFPA